ncbi:VanZ family protein [Liquorilactobacillus satsumensis]|uniref:VanZ family protein n=1 Tax=Liquorilactobacillus satsumensis DSM 16230 = JCM 12392 TaxID=1423801 RepID=A0A0R1V4M5_9LACO|nr:VanZ family protein [Liquorilactobacillus satsumensis]KRM00558.1 VanZ family protein [Liquorilactobacillus satsumensis DSM 16230 = JCM 12392]MCC7667390.1 VanZ family protein [Liquorilactobacillus satsumensis]MCP9313249.1 VanZ family protein [Liquorilactobacillus satsumensis]MCP9329501.1 VanZ family protein [Liquorilactobacillus satsumensis]MCP9358170.1 VanZ family protein [Liquorilactobacillus satsumensis]
MRKYLKINADTFLLLAFLIMLVLFISSAMTYQQQTTVPFLEKYLAGKPFNHFLNGFSFTYATEQVSIAKLGYFKFVEFFIRKAAHFTSYLFLGTFLYIGLKPRLNSLALSIFISALTAIGYAAFDEFHQMLTGGRTPLFQDVALDGCGALVGILVLGIYWAQRQK